MRSFFADVATGIGVSWVNDIPAFWPTVIILVLRIFVEWLILKNRNREQKKP